MKERKKETKKERKKERMEYLCFFQQKKGTKKQRKKERKKERNKESKKEGKKERNKERLRKPSLLVPHWSNVLLSDRRLREKEADDVQIIYAFAEALFYTNNHSQFMHLLIAF